MTTTPEAIGGADTHADTIHVTLISTLGQQIADREFSTTAAGYAAASDPTVRCVLSGLKNLAERHHFLGTQIAELTAGIDELVTTANPGLRASHGVGSDTATQLLITAGGNPERLRSEASFAALCGVAPVPASSERTVRHRLSRGGDRHAKNITHTAVANHFGVWPGVISRIERGLQRHDELADQYRTWLDAA